MIYQIHSFRKILNNALGSVQAGVLDVTLWAGFVTAAARDCAMFTSLFSLSRETAFHAKVGTTFLTGLIVRQDLCKRVFHQCTKCQAHNYWIIFQKYQTLLVGVRRSKGTEKHSWRAMAHKVFSDTSCISNTLHKSFTVRPDLAKVRRFGYFLKLLAKFFGKNHHPKLQFLAKF